MAPVFALPLSWQLRPFPCRFALFAALWWIAGNQTPRTRLLADAGLWAWSFCRRSGLAVHQHEPVWRHASANRRDGSRFARSLSSAVWRCCAGPGPQGAAGAEQQGAKLSLAQARCQPPPWWQLAGRWVKSRAATP